MSDLVETAAAAVNQNPDESSSNNELINAAREVIKTFHATGANKDGLVSWGIDPTAMRRLIIAVGKFDWNEVYA